MPGKVHVRNRVSDLQLRGQGAHLPVVERVLCKLRVVHGLVAHVLIPNRKPAHLFDMRLQRRQVLSQPPQRFRTVVRRHADLHHALFISAQQVSGEVHLKVIDRGDVRAL